MNFTQNAGMAGGMMLNASMESQPGMKHEQNAANGTNERQGHKKGRAHNGAPPMETMKK